MTNYTNSNQNRAGEAILIADEIDFKIKIVQRPSTLDNDKRVNLSREKQLQTKVHLTPASKRQPNP